MNLKQISLFLALTAVSLTTLAGRKIVNAHFSKRSLVVQIQNDQTGSTRWFSSSKIGVINATLGCNGHNCLALNLKRDRDALYADVAIADGSNTVLEDVFLLSFYEDTLIDPSQIQLSEKNGKPIILIPVK